MTASFERADFEHRIAMVDDLVQKLESAPDPVFRSTAQDLVQTLMELHGTGLERIVAVLQGGGQAGHALLDDLLGDDRVRCLLLLYGLHPTDVITRVQQALEKTRPYLKSHGGNVELLGVEDGEVRLRMQGSCHGCPSSAITLKLAIEQAIHEAAPDVTAIVVDDASQRQDPHSPLVQIATPNGRTPVQAAGWEDVAALDDIGAFSLRTATVLGRDLLFCRVGETLFAYHSKCPACAHDLGGGGLDGAVLSCQGCSASFDVVRAGRGLTRTDLYLEPVPLLVEGGRVRIAIHGAAPVATR